MVIKLLLRFLLGLCFVTLVACGGSNGGDNSNTGAVKDTTNPSITLLGATPLNLSIGDTYTDPGAAASDNIDGNITSSIVVGGDTVNTAIAGTYVVTYDAKDAAGNSAVQITRTVIVSDTTPPAITLLGANPVNLLIGNTYTDPGATASDDIDGNITGSIVIGADTVNTAISGTYVVTYDVSDAAGNPAIQVLRTVIISTVDTTAPVLTLLGAASLNLTVGDTYADPGATASDDIGGVITGAIVTGGDTVNTAIAGTYVVTYDVSDAAGNPATQLTRTVTVSIADITPPAITLSGANPLNLAVDDTYTDPGATASDNIDGDITSSIVVAGDTVNTAVAGSYVVTYDVSDLAGNLASQVTRTVVVVNTPPVINSFNINPSPVLTGASATFSWVVNDVNGDTLTCLLDVDDNGTNDYTINDCANNVSQIHIFSLVGDYTARLSVSDGMASPVESTVSFTVLSPLSTDVSINSPAIAGERLLYTITVGNTSAQSIDNVAVSFVVPANLFFHWSKDAEPDVSTGCGNCYPLGEATWSLGTLASGESRTIIVNTLVDAATLNGVNITLPVKFSATSISPVQIDKTVEVFNNPSADLAVSASTDPVVPNETFTYNLEVGNTSGTALTTIELRTFLPVGVTVNSISDGGTEVNPGEVVWDVASLGVTSSLHREITVTADAALIAGQILQTRAQLTHDGGLAVDNTAEHAVTVVSSALPLSVDVSTSANPVVSGDRVFITLTVSNTSLSPVDSVAMLLRVPAGLSFYKEGNVEPAAICLNSNCDPAEEALWNLGTLIAGESRTITVDALVAPAILSGNLISIPVRVTAAGLEDDIDRLATVAVYNATATDFALTASADPVAPNEVFAYHLDVGNVSAGALSTLQMRASLPAGVTVVSISDGGAEVSAGEVVWDVASLAVGDSLQREVTVMASAGLTAGEILDTHARLTHEGGLALDKVAEQALTVVPSALPLSVDVSRAISPVSAGEFVLHTLTVSNTSLLPVDNVSVLLRIPPGLSLEYRRDLDPAATFVNNCGTTTCLPTAEVIWNLGALIAGESRSISVNTRVDAGLLSGNLILLPVRVTATGLGDDIDRATTVAVFNAGAAEMVLSATSSLVMPNQTFAYKIDVGNVGVGALRSLQLRASLPAGVTVASISHGGTEVRAGEVVWDVASLDVGASLHRAVTVTADTGLVAGQILQVKARLTHDGGLEVDNTARQVVTAVSSAPLLNVDVSTAGPAVAGERMLYTLTLSNASLLPANEVNVLLRLPAGLSLESGQRNADPIATFEGCGSSTCFGAATVNWNLGMLAAGESRTMTANMLVDAAMLSGNLLALPVRVTAADMGGSINMLKTVAVFNAPLAALAVGASTDPVTPNETFTYNLDIGNASAGALTALQLRASLPAGVTVTAVSGAGTEVSTGEIVWDIGDLVAGASQHREVTVVADSAAAGDILKLHAELSHDGGLALDNTADFAVSVATNVSRLSLLIATTPDPVISPATLIYGSLVYTITVTNDYALPVDGVEVMFRVPAEVTFRNRDATPSPNAPVGQKAGFDLGTMAAGTSQVITINTAVLPGLNSGTLISEPVRVTATGLPDIINLQHTTTIQN